MKVVEIGNLKERNGGDLPEAGIVIEATKDELKAIAGNIFGKTVELRIVDEQKTVWNADSIAVNIEHSVGYFPHAYVSVNMTAYDRNNDAVIQQERLAEEIATLVTAHTTHKENE